MPVEDAIPQSQGQNGQSPDKLEYPITITNGAAKMLKQLMEHFHFETAKDVVGLSLELLESVKDSASIIVQSKDGTAKKLIMPTSQNGTPHQKD